MIVAWGEKIGLRAFEDKLSDTEIARVYKWSRDSDILQFSGGVPVELTLEEFSRRLARERKSPPTDRRMFFIVTHAGKLIGRIGCFALDQHAREGELGIVIGERAYWNRGYGRDAVITLLNYLFDNTSLERLTLYTYPENVRAQRCFAACGFRTVGTTRRYVDAGEFVGIEMEITRAEFSAGLAPRLTHTPIPQGHQ